MKLSELIAKYSSEDEFLSVLKTEVIKLGTENPDFIYNLKNGGRYCSYSGPSYNETWSDKLGFEKVQIGPECKGCIFGQAFQNMGWNSEEEMAGPIIYVLKNRGIDRQKLNILQEIQSKQDFGASWGEAIKPLLEV
jgi:hypothetical protein